MIPGAAACPTNPPVWGSFLWGSGGLRQGVLPVLARGDRFCLSGTVWPPRGSHRPGSGAERVSGCPAGNRGVPAAAAPLESPGWGGEEGQGWGHSRRVTPGWGREGRAGHTGRTPSRAWGSPLPAPPFSLTFTLTGHPRAGPECPPTPGAAPRVPRVPSVSPPCLPCPLRVTLVSSVNPPMSPRVPLVPSVSPPCPFLVPRVSPVSFPCPPVSPP